MVEQGKMVVKLPGRGLAHFLPRQTITVTDSHGVRNFTLSPFKRLFWGTVLVIFLIWAVIASITLVIYSLGEDKMRQRSAVLTLAYESQLKELQLERDFLSGQVFDVTNRMFAAQNRLLIQQQNILQLGAEQQNLDANLTNMRDQLAGMLAERDFAIATGDILTRDLATVRSLMTERLGGQDDVLSTIEALAGALADAVETRDTAQAGISGLNEQIAAMTMQRELSTQRQDRVLTQLEGAIEASLVPLSTLFDAVGMDVDSILANVRQNYSGTGGISDEEVLGEIDPTDLRINQLLQNMDAVASLNLAANQLPLAFPLRTAYRQTSPFGPRGGRIHKGLDLAGARDSPILATGDGVVSFAGVQSGFGNLVIIDHANGYQTYYAHLARTRTTAGTVVARGDLIGDMGNSGRSSGVHVHYEIRTDGVSFNPMTFIKAGRNVY